MTIVKTECPACQHDVTLTPDLVIVAGEGYVFRHCEEPQYRPASPAIRSVLRASGATDYEGVLGEWRRVLGSASWEDFA